MRQTPGSTNPTGVPSTRVLSRAGTTTPKWAFSSFGVCTLSPPWQVSGSGTTGERGAGRRRNLWGRTTPLGSHTRISPHSSRRSCTIRSSGWTSLKLLAQSTYTLHCKRHARRRGSVLFCCFLVFECRVAERRLGNIQVFNVKWHPAPGILVVSRHTDLGARVSPEIAWNCCLCTRQDAVRIHSSFSERNLKDNKCFIDISHVLLLAGT